MLLNVSCNITYSFLLLARPTFPARTLLDVLECNDNNTNGLNGRGSAPLGLRARSHMMLLRSSMLGGERKASAEESTPEQ